MAATSDATISPAVASSRRVIVVGGGGRGASRGEAGVVTSTVPIAAAAATTTTTARRGREQVAVHHHHHHLDESDCSNPQQGTTGLRTIGSGRASSSNSSSSSMVSSTSPTTTIDTASDENDFGLAAAAAPAASAAHISSAGGGVQHYQHHSSHQHQQHQESSSSSMQKWSAPPPSNNLLNNRIHPTLKDDRKLFVGGLPQDVTPEEFLAYFEQFGVVLDSVVMYDRQTRMSRGFGFVTFEDPSVCHHLLRMGRKDDSGEIPRSNRLAMREKIIEIKVSKPKASAAASQPHRSHIANLPASEIAGKPPHRSQQQQHGPLPPIMHHNRPTPIPEDRRAPQVGYHQPQHAPPAAARYDHMANKHPATLPQMPRFSANPYGYARAAPPTPNPYYGGGGEGGEGGDPVATTTAVATPITPQQAFDMAHHMMFYSHLLATPSLMSPLMSPMMTPMAVGSYEPQNYSEHFQPYVQEEPTAASSSSSPSSQQAAQPRSPIPPAPTMQTGKPFTIGGAHFYPDASSSPQSPSLHPVKPGIPRPPPSQEGSNHKEMNASPDGKH